MNFIYFICPEIPQYAKYCEGFFNYLTYGYRTWQRDGYAHVSEKDRKAKSRILMSKEKPIKEEMKAGDLVLDKIYEKVITSDCYEHSYTQISELDIKQSEQIVFITSSKSPKIPPKYLYNNNNSVVVWKMSNIKKFSRNKFLLLEALIRKIAKPKN